MRFLVLFAVFATTLFSYIGPLNAENNDRAAILFSEDPWPPYTFGQEGEPPTGGMAVELITEIFKRLDMPVEMRLCPWKRCLSEMMTGRRDALMLLGFSQERTAYLLYSEPVIEVRDIVFFRQNIKSEWTTLNDLAGLRFGRTFGFQYGIDFENFARSGKIIVEEAQNDLANLRKLATGRIDAFIINEITASQLLKDNPDLTPQIKSATKPIKSDPLYIGFSKFGEATDIVPGVNQVLKKMREEGVIDKIFLGK